MNINERRKQIFSIFVSRPYSNENIDELVKQFNLSRATILRHIRYYAKNDATPKELILYNKRIHERERFVDYRVGLKKKHSDSHYFKYFKIILILCNELDKYIISDDYSKLINYLENTNINLNNTEAKQIFFKYLDEIYSKEESDKLKEKINYISDIFNCFMQIKKVNLRKEQNHLQRLLEAKKYLKLYLLELSEEKLFLTINTIKRDRCIKILEDYDNMFILDFLEKEERIMKEVENKEKEKINEIANFVFNNKNSFLDYHLLFNYDLKNVLARARKYQLINCVSTISHFYNKYVNQHLIVEESFYKFETRINAYGNEYLISKAEKIVVMNYIKEHNLPKTHEIVNQILKKIILGELELKNKKIYKKILDNF